MGVQNSKYAIRACYNASIMSFIITSFIGLFSLMIAQVLPNSDPSTALFNFISDEMTGVSKIMLIYFFVIAIFSSLTANLHLIGGIFTNDFLLNILKLKIQNNSQIIISRAATLLLGLISTWIASQLFYLEQLSNYAVNLWIAVILPPLFATIYGVKCTPWQFMVGFITSIMVIIIWESYFLESTKVVSSLPAFLIHAIILWLCNMMTK